jgi:hypothetical protein
LEAELAQAVAPAPRLHPNLAEVCRPKVPELVQALQGAEGGEARELVRSLVEEITLYPDHGELRVEMRWCRSFGQVLGRIS